MRGADLADTSSVPPSALHLPSAPPAPRAWRSVLRSRAFWLAALCALLLHFGSFIGWRWWGTSPLPQPSQHIKLMVQLITPPTHNPGDALSTPPVTPQTPQTPQEPQPPQLTDSAPPPPPPPAQQKQNPNPHRATPHPRPAASPAPKTPQKQTPQQPATAAQNADLAALAAQEVPAYLRSMEAPDSMLLQYSITQSMPNQPPSTGSAQLLWRNAQQKRYALHWQQNIEGQSKEADSTGLLGNYGVQPARYSEKTSSSSERATHFVFDQQQTIFSNNSPSAPWVPGMQDRLSLLIQLGGILAIQSNAQPLPDQIDLPVASLSKASVWSFHLLGLQAPPAAYVSHVSPPAHETWFAVRYTPPAGSPAWEPSLTIWYSTQSFLPMRIQTALPNGRTEDALLTGAGDVPKDAPPFPSP